MEHPNKKHKSSSEIEEPLPSNNTSSDTRMDFVREVVVNVFNSYPSTSVLTNQEELVKILSHRLCLSMQSYHQTVKDADAYAQKFDDMKDEVKQLTAIINRNNAKHKKRSSSSASCQTESDHLNESIEVCRRQEMNRVSDQMFSVEDNHKYLLNSTNKSLLSNGRQLDKKLSECDNIESVDKRMLLDQIKQLQENFQSERQSYLSENERLNSIVEENIKLIDELKCDLKKLSSNKSVNSGHKSRTNSHKSIHNDSSTDLSKDYSRLAGYVLLGYCVIGRTVHISCVSLVYL